MPRRISAIILGVTLGLGTGCTNCACPEPASVNWSGWTGKLAFTSVDMATCAVVLDSATQTVETQLFTERSGTSTPAVLSPDATRLVTSTMTQDASGWELLLLTRASGEVRSLALGGNIKLPQWAVSGQSIWFVDQGGIFEIGADGTGKHALDLPDLRGSGTFYGAIPSPDGTRVVVDRLDGARRVVAAAPTTGSAADGLKTIVDDGYPISWSPDGALIAYVRKTGAFQEGGRATVELRVVKPDGTGDALVKSMVEEGLVDDVHGSFSPDGKQLAYAFGSARTTDPDGGAEQVRIVGVDGKGEIMVTSDNHGWGAPSWVR